MKTVNTTKNTLIKSVKSRKNPPGASREFAPILRWVCIAAWILKLIPIPIGLWNARLLSRTVTSAVAGDSGNVLKSGAVLLLLLALTKTFDFVTGSKYKKAASQALHRCKLLLYRRFLSCPLSVLYRMEHGQAVEMLNDDFNTVTGKSLNLYPGFFTGLATFAVYFAFLLTQNLPAALALLGISILQVVPPLLFKDFFSENYSDTRDIEADITNCTLEYYHGFDTIKMFGLKEWCLDRLARLHKDYLKIGNRSEASVTVENALDQLIGNILTYGTYGLMGLFILKEYTGLDTAVEALALSGGLYASIKSVFETIPSFAVARAADKRMALLYEETSSLDSSNDKRENTVSITSPGICIEGVSCGFDDRQLLVNTHITIPADQISVIHGANGIGKSTLLKLVLGMLKPDTGVITVDRISSQALPQDSFPGHLFYLPQEDAAFHISAAELYAAVPGADTEAALSYAALFSLPEESLKQPIDTLSGGQRKKVFLSLAFAENPDLMLLDEPSNSLDAESRETLVRLLQKRSGGAVIITHDAVFDDIADAFYALEKNTIFILKGAL